MTQLPLALLSGVIGAAVALWTSERRITLANVTAERAQWRARMRSMADSLLCEGGTAERRRAALGIQLSTNPFDRLDREIVEIAWRIARADGPSAGVGTDGERLALRLQLLLKHDWERAKREASWVGAAGAAARRLTGRSRRVGSPDYRRFLGWRDRHVLEIEERLPPP